MLFNSYIFILFFLPLCLAGYFLPQAAWNIRLRKQGAAGPGRLQGLKGQYGKIWLTAMSLWFYAFFNRSYLAVILTSIAVNYLLYRLMGLVRSKGKSLRWLKALTASGIFYNLGVLFYFKYYDFFIENINEIFRAGFPLKHILLPLGISFFTFQQVGFIVDVYRGQTGEYSFWDYALFVTFFPQLIAGPIVTHAEMVPQFKDPSRKTFCAENFTKGCYAFTLGLSKKVLLADNLGAGVDWAFANFGQVNAAGTVVMMLSYALQLYFDFSGYCDMARGIGKMFNIEIPVNFNSPYKSLDLIDFWKRWHITLGRFFTQYFYIPLGGSRKGMLRGYLNVFLVYLVSGLWHGAGWTYIIWGTLNGVVYVLTKLFYRGICQIPKAVRWTGNMLFFVFSLIFFRSESVEQALDVIRTIGTLDFSVSKIPAAMAACYQMEEFWYPLKLIGMEGLPYGNYFMMFGLLLTGWLIVLCCKNVNERMEQMSLGWKQAAVCGGLLVWNVVSFAGVSSFLYFNF